jgi:hypothetical protein
MRKCLCLIAFVSGAALAHGDQRPRNDAADAQARDHASPDANLRKETNGRQYANQRKPADDQPRFCVRNHLGRVNCIVYPASHGH